MSVSTHPAAPGAPAPDPDGSTRTPITKVVFASLVGTAVEWYDFFLYGSAAALVFGTLFFPESDPVTGTLLAFGTYALGFVARPLGGVVFGHFGDRVGRKKMLVVALLMMGLATFAIGLLPTYASIGLAAPILLLVCRLLQGFAVGGEWGGAVLMAAEHGDPARRGFWSSWPQAGVPLGNLLATAVLFVLAAVQSDETFLIGLWVRLQLEESSVYQEAKAEMAERTDDAHLPILEVLRRYPREVLVAMGMRMAENISYYLFTVVVLTYAKDFADIGTDLILQMLLIGAAIQFFLIPAIGALSDRVGRRPLYLVGAIGVAVWIFPFFGLASSGEPGKVLLAVVVGLFFHSLMYSPQAAFFSELFGTSVRYTGASVGYQLASIFAGALAPIIAVKLLASGDGDNTTAVGIYLVVASAITVAAVLAAKETRNTSLHHDRVLG